MSRTPSQPSPQPSELRLSADKRMLTVSFGLARYTLDAEYLRVESPSAEVKGHGPGDERLISGKRGVTVTGLEAVGNYAVKILFSDGHTTGLYTWSTLAQLGQEHAERWRRYEADLATAGLSREVAAAPVPRPRA